MARRITIQKLRAYYNYEEIRRRARGRWRKYFAKYRASALKQREFTIISNNCWGGTIYESYNLPKMSPTVGLFIMADDYIRFCSDLKGYLAKELTFIPPTQSVHFEELQNTNNFGKYPVGLLGDVEIMFLHYHSEQEAKEKWERRCKRINWDKMIVKFNDQNGCTYKEAQAFFELPLKNKLFFTVHRDWPKLTGGGITSFASIQKSNMLQPRMSHLGKIGTLI